jgi:hypothetical protein
MQLSFKDFDDSTYIGKSWLHRRVSTARDRARRTGKAFTIDDAFVAELYRTQKGRCAVTDLKFNLHRFPSLVRYPFAPSIDRRLSSGGYTKDNVRLVCVAVNFGMGQWGEEFFLKIAQAAIENDAQRRRLPMTETDAQWRDGFTERIEAAEDLLASLPENEKAKQRRRISTLKSALTRGLR